MLDCDLSAGGRRIREGSCASLYVADWNWLRYYILGIWIVCIVVRDLHEVKMDLPVYLTSSQLLQ